MKLHLLVALAVVAAAGTAFAAVKSPAGAAFNPTTSNTARIDGVVERTMRRLDLPSVSLALVLDDRVAYVRAYGSASPRTRYEIGSVTKQFTAACILLLQQQGKLHLDDPIAKYLPDLPNSGGVTIRQLLTHTSGYDDYYATLSNRALFTNRSLESIVREYASRRLDFDPGTQWNYSNTGYAILTELIQRVSGMDYGSFVALHIFRPLQMHSAVYEERPAFGRVTAVGYDRILLGPEAIARPEGVGWLNGAAGLAMTASDLARWDVALMEDRLLSARSTREMFTAERLRSGRSTGYGLGIYVAQVHGRVVLSHTGAVQGFSSESAFIRRGGSQSSCFAIKRTPLRQGISQEPSRVPTVSFRGRPIRQRALSRSRPIPAAPQILLICTALKRCTTSSKAGTFAYPLLPMKPQWQPHKDFSAWRRFFARWAARRLSKMPNAISAAMLP